MIRLSEKVMCSIILTLGLAILLGYGLVSYAAEDIVVNATTSGGKILFQDNDSHGVYLLGRAWADFGSNATFSNVTPSIETGTGRSVFLVTCDNARGNELSRTRTAVFTLTVWNPAGVPHSTTREFRGICSETLSVDCTPFEPGEGRFEVTTTIRERQLNLPAVFGR
ncbi:MULTISPECIES: hypothetical protein [Methanoculleus]|uniref:hypothetical protein n=1 Tax=Methanoculleus TaxID=45989 RepID=UPI001CD0E6F2|nr:MULTISPECIES: hypothetical protein [Methanoculleus]